MVSAILVLGLFFLVPEQGESVVAWLSSPAFIPSVWNGARSPANLQQPSDTATRGLQVGAAARPRLMNVRGKMILMCAMDEEEYLPGQQYAFNELSTVSGSATLYREPLREERRQNEVLNSNMQCHDEMIMSAGYRMLHRDLHSWHDIYNWYQSFHAPAFAGETELQLRRNLCEALRVGDMITAARLREEIIAIDSRDYMTRLQDELETAVRFENYELAAKIRDELWHAKLARQAASYPKYGVGLIVEHSRNHYRGVILALDQKCEASEEWMNTMGVDSLLRGRRQPFYSVLVDVNDRGPDPQICYVAQENLYPSEHGDIVEHPLVTRLFQPCIEELASPILVDSGPTSPLLDQSVSMIPFVSGMQGPMLS